MDFRLDDEQLALQETVAGFCASRHPLASVAERDGVPAAQGWAELADLGVFSLLVPEADGGLGVGLAEAVLVFEQLGRHLVGGPLLWSTLGAPVLGSEVGRSSLIGGLDLPVGLDDPLLVEHAAELDVLLVLQDGGVFAIDRSDLPVPEPAEPIDPLTPVGRYTELPAGRPVGDAARAARLRAEGTVLTAALQLGLSDSALQAARDYALERQQFGQPIATFQALKHMMADMFVRTSLARSATYAAAAVLDDPEVGHAERSVSAAKLLAGEAAIENARAAIQIFGGMGFTWEMLPNYLLKRAWVLENTFGTATAHALSISSSLAGEVA